MKNITLTILIIACLAGGLFLYAKYDKTGAPAESEKPVDVESRKPVDAASEKPAGKLEATDYKNISYVIEEDKVTLTNGISNEAVAPGSATRIVTKYFGNDLRTDLNNDGREDVVFLLTQDPGGSGTFYYVVAALNTDNGYRGSAGYLLGDRIAPQSIDMSQNPNHKNVIVVNYFDHATDAPMAEKPKLAKSVWLKLDPDIMQFGEVEYVNGL